MYIITLCPLDLRKSKKNLRNFNVILSISTYLYKCALKLADLIIIYLKILAQKNPIYNVVNCFSHHFILKNYNGN